MLITMVAVVMHGEETEAERLRATGESASMLTQDAQLGKL